MVGGGGAGAIAIAMLCLRIFLKWDILFWEVGKETAASVSNMVSIYVKFCNKILQTKGMDSS